MKALVCRKCLDVRALPRSYRVAVICECGSSSGWWEDPERGIARFAGLDGRNVWMLGMNNHYLLSVLTHEGPQLTDADYRDIHTEAAKAPGYHFDAERKNCWAILIRPGYSSDTRLVTTAPRDLTNRPKWLPLECCEGPHVRTCGPTGDDMFCACGCGGDDSRCWLEEESDA